MRIPRFYYTSCLLLASFLGTGEIPAGGFEYGVQGMETVSRGGANVARVSGPEALYLNVAGIGKTDGLRLLVDSNFIAAGITADLYGNGENSWEVPGAGEIEYIPVTNSTDIYPGGFKMLPALYMGLTFPLPRLDKFSLGLGFFGPAGFGNYQFPERVTVEQDGASYSLPSPQRYDIISQDVLFYWPTIAAAYRITEKLTLGAGFQWGILHFKFTGAINNTVVSTSTSYRNDTLSTFDAWDWFVPGGIFGLQWVPLPRLEMACSMRFSGPIKMKGKLVSVTDPWSDDPENPPVYSNDPEIEWMDRPPYKRPSGAMSFKWPAVYRFGIRYVHPKGNAPAKGRRLYPWESELFDVEMGLFLELNYVVEDVRMEVDGYIPYGTNEGEAFEFKPASDGVVYIRRNWRSSYSVRLGGSVNLFKGRLTASWGGFYESPTTEKEDLRLDYFTSRRWALGCGLQGRWFDFTAWKKRRVDLEAGISYIHFFFPRLNVTEGRIRHVSGTSDAGSVINNGQWEFSLDILTAGLRVTFL